MATLRRNIQRIAAAISLTIAVSPALGQTVLFQDDFNTTLSGANYMQASTSQTAVTYAFDYSALGIPVAPSTLDGTRLGVKFEANMSAGAQNAVTLHTVQQMTGQFTVMFDAWINANGPFPAGGTGSTEMLTAGVGGNGTAVNGSTSASTAQTGSGGWTAVTGEGGAAADFRLVKTATEQGVATNQYAAGAAANARDGANAYYSQFTSINVGDLPVQGVNNGGFPQQNGSTAAGSVGFAWRQVELRVDPAGGTGGATSMAWYIDGLRIGTLDAGASGSFSSNGSVTIGYWDPFASVSDNATLSFGLIDNLRVVAPAAVTDADFDNDGDVDGRDFLTWQRNTGTSGNNSTGDADGNGQINGLDLAAWNAAYGTGATSAPAAGAVPEPTTMLMLLIGALAALVRSPRP